MARQAPTNKAAQRGTAVGRAGLYAAPVDTTGMDSGDKESLKIGQKKRKRKGLIDRIKGAMGIQY